MKREVRCKRAGAKAGRAAASWYFDGNTTPAKYEVVLRGIDDGDPRVLDALPYLDLSGQWADGPSPEKVLAEIGYADGFDERQPEAAEEAINLYEQAYNDAMVDELARVARLYLKPEPKRGRAK